MPSTLQTHDGLFFEEHREFPDEVDGDLIVAYLLPESEAAIKALDRAKPAESDHVHYTTRLSHTLANERSSGSSAWAYKIAASDMLEQKDGWSLGSGNWRRGKKVALRGVHFLLSAIRDKRARQHISDVHGRFFVHEQSGAWMFQNMSKEHPVTYVDGRGSGDMTIGYQGRAVLWKSLNRLEFGPYRFLLQFTAPSDDDAARTEHESRYLNVRDTLFDDTVVSRHLHALPRDAHGRSGYYVLHEDTISANLSQSTRVQAGVNAQTGDAVAVKQFQHGTTSGEHCYLFSQHYANLMHFRDNPIGILPFYHAWCEHGRRVCRADGSERRYISTPLALDDFGGFDFASISFRTRLGLFHQTLQGLATMHARSFMHRAIKPGHLLILSIDPNSPSAAICDLGASVRGSTDSGRDISPTHAVAPEVWKATDKKPYTLAVDVWSLAYSWLWTLAPQKIGVPGWDKEDWNVVQDYTYSGIADFKGLVSRERYTTIISFIDTAIALPCVPTSDDEEMMRDGLKALLKAMLTWDPRVRISAEEALGLPIWASLTEERPRPGGTLEAEPQGPKGLKGPKRVRPVDNEANGQPAKKARRRKGDASVSVQTGVPVQTENVVEGEFAT